MSKSFSQIRICLWPTRTLTTERQEEVVEEWQELLDSRNIGHVGTHMKTTLCKDSDEDFSAAELIDLMSLAPNLEQIEMLDVYAIDSALGEEVSFRVHLDHDPVREVFKLYLRHVVSPEEALACLIRFNRAAKQDEGRAAIAAAE